MKLDVAKKQARKMALAARKAAWEKAAEITQAATEALLAEIGPAPAIIAGYMPIRTEIDPRPAMTALAATHRLAVPVIEAAGQPLRFREWHPGCAMDEGMFGAQIPQSGDWLRPDLLIVPLVGFDQRGGRLGYGGGFYDRTLAQLRRAGPVRAIGFAFAAQELPEVPQEPNDVALDLIVTELGAVRPQT